MLMPSASSIQPCSRTVPTLSGPGNAAFILLIPLRTAGAGRTNVHGSLSAGSGLEAWDMCARVGTGMVLHDSWWFLPLCFGSASAALTLSGC